MTPAPNSSCAWGVTSALMLAYHDTEWGVPVHDDRKHFEFLVLDAFQAGLSWALVLNKRENFRSAFAGFDPSRVARFGAAQVRKLLKDEGIVRNRQKIEATVSNARAFLELQEKEGSFDAYIWRFVDGRTRHNAWQTMRQIPPRTSESDAMSKALKALGFKFVGSTICYSYMQAAGLVNDHIVTCVRHSELARRRQAPK
jgi:DNA-3-methyladenine glycosylase I